MKKMKLKATYCKTYMETEENIQKTEKMLNIKFPVKYREMVKKGLYDIDDEEDEISIRFDSQKDIREFMNPSKSDVPKILPEKVVCFGDNGGGMFYCFDFKESEDDPRIVWIDYDNGVFADDYDDDWEETLEEAQRDELRFVLDSFNEIADNIIEEEDR